MMGFKELIENVKIRARIKVDELKAKYQEVKT